MKTGNHDLENELILELCKFKSYNREKIEASITQGADLQYILGHLLFNRVGGTAYFTLDKCGILSKINREFRNPLKMNYEASVTKTQSFLKAESIIAEIFARADFNYAFLKGAFLVSIYPCGLRTSNDFDILINQSDIQKVSRLLESAGFIQGFLRNEVFTPATRSEIIFARMNKGETVPFVKSVDLPGMPYLEIDVNFSLDFKAKQSSDVVSKILDKTEPIIATENRTLLALSKVTFLIHLCAHLYKEATTFYWVNVNRDLSLYKFCDIYLFSQLFMDEPYAAELKNAIIEYGLQKECYYSFYYTRYLFNIKNEFFDFVINSIESDDKSFLTQIFDPEGNKTLEFHMDYKQYIFCSDRKACLNEVIS